MCTRDLLIEISSGYALQEELWGEKRRREVEILTKTLKLCFRTAINLRYSLKPPSVKASDRRRRYTADLEDALADDGHRDKIPRIRGSVSRAYYNCAIQC